MGTRPTYSKEFRDSVILKVMNRGSRKISDVCEQEGVSKGSVTNWLRASGSVISMKKKPRKWSAEEKLEALSKTRNMADTELGVYLRQEGLHSHRLTEWRADALKSLDGASAKPQKPKADERDQKIAALERDLLRKDRALAEASALLILQKKVQLIWAKNDEEES